MKYIIKSSIFFILMYAMAVYSALSQTDRVVFGYDDAGNRISRTIIVGGEKSTADDDFFNEETNEFIEEPENKFQDSLGELEITLFPNPTAGQVIVQITNLPDEVNARIVVYDLDGKIVYQMQNLTEYTNIDITGSPYGTYILRIIAGEDVSEWKIIKR